MSDSDQLKNSNNEQTTNLQDTQATYEVGYAKPPKDTQFKKGKSGNPNGRPKGSKNFSTIVTEEAHSLITITENGKRKQITKVQAAVKQLANKAASGDMRAIDKLSQLMLEFEDKAETANTTTFHFKEEDLAIMQNFSAHCVGETEHDTAQPTD